MAVLRLTFVIGVVICLISPSLGTYLKAALGFRIGLSPTEKGYGEKGNYGQGSGVNAQFLSGVRGNPQGGPHGHSDGGNFVRHLKILGVNLYLGGQQKPQLGWKPSHGGSEGHKQQIQIYKVNGHNHGVYGKSFMGGTHYNGAQHNSIKSPPFQGVEYKQNEIPGSDGGQDGKIYSPSNLISQSYSPKLLQIHMVPSASQIPTYSSEVKSEIRFLNGRGNVQHSGPQRPQPPQLHGSRPPPGQLGGPSPRQLGGPPPPQLLGPPPPSQGFSLRSLMKGPQWSPKPKFLSGLFSRGPPIPGPPPPPPHINGPPRPNPPPPHTLGPRSMFPAQQMTPMGPAASHQMPHKAPMTYSTLFTANQQNGHASSLPTFNPNYNFNHSSNDIRSNFHSHHDFPGSPQGPQFHPQFKPQGSQGSFHNFPSFNAFSPMPSFNQQSSSPSEGNGPNFAPSGGSNSNNPNSGSTSYVSNWQHPFASESQSSNYPSGQINQNQASSAGLIEFQPENQKDFGSSTGPNGYQASNQKEFESFSGPIEYGSQNTREFGVSGDQMGYGPGNQKDFGPSGNYQGFSTSAQKEYTPEDQSQQKYPSGGQNPQDVSGFGQGQQEYSPAGGQVEFGPESQGQIEMYNQDSMPYQLPEGFAYTHSVTSPVVTMKKYTKDDPPVMMDPESMYAEFSSKKTYNNNNNNAQNYQTSPTTQDSTVLNSGGYNTNSRNFDAQIQAPSTMQRKLSKSRGLSMSMITAATSNQHHVNNNLKKWSPLPPNLSSVSKKLARNKDMETSPTEVSIIDSSERSMVIRRRTTAAPTSSTTSEASSLTTTLTSKL